MTTVARLAAVAERGKAADVLADRLRVRVRLRELTVQRRKYSPDQPRDEHGRWGEGGVGEVSATGEITPKQAEATAKLFESATIATGKEGPVPNVTMRGHDTPGFTEADVEKQLQSLYSVASPDFKEQGAAWYGAAHDLAGQQAALYGIKPEQAAAVIAALSPQTEWDRNVSMAKAALAIANDRAGEKLTITAEDVKALTGKQVGMSAAEAKALIGTHEVGKLPLPALAALHPDLAVQSHANALKALQLARGGDIDKILGGNKVRTFYDAIVDPKGDHAVIDTHQLRASLGVLGTTDHQQAALLQSAPRYDFFAKATSNAAKALGIPTPQFQATIWTAWRHDHPASSRRMAGPKA